MGAVTILLGLGICVFLIWFFKNIANDFAADDNSETEYIYLRRDTECAGNRTYSICCLILFIGGTDYEERNYFTVPAALQSDHGLASPDSRNDYALLFPYY